jgi:hypothetical protein
VTFEVLAVLFWIVAPCRLVRRNTHFGETHFSPSSGFSPEALKMETACFSNTLISTYECTCARTPNNAVILKIPYYNAYPSADSFVITLYIPLLTTSTYKLLPCTDLVIGY